jgi:hypothetical protein
MRFLRLISASSFLASVSASTCQALCTSLSECATDPYSHGSYCKTWQDPQVCFGLYWTDETQTTMCFQPNNVDCREDLPVACPTPVAPTCEEICQSVSACRNDPHGHGSFCKTWQEPQVCFGLYRAAGGDTCFQPNDDSCREDEPVLCGDSV